MHIDADAFFASVEQVLNPKLRGKAVLVGGPSSTHGIVSAASYEARQFGVHSGMPIYQAKRLCPKGVVVSGNFDMYRDFSKRMYEIFCKATPEVEMCSIDEGYLDITGFAEHFGDTPEEYAKMILMEIYAKLGLSVSCGLASSKTVAKVASSQNKPHKLTVVPFGGEQRFLAPLELRALPGIGPRTYIVLERAGLKTLGDLSALSLIQVIEKLGVQGVPLWKKAQGVDNTPVVATASLPKSISKERTFYEGTQNEQTCLKHLKELSVMVCAKLRAYEMKAGQITVRIRYKNEDRSENKRIFEDFSFQKNLDMPCSSDSKIFPELRKLFLKNLLLDKKIRLVGVGVGKLFQNYNLSLFQHEQDDDRIFAGIDSIRALYGDGVVKYGA